MKKVCYHRVMNYTTDHVAKLYSITTETVRNWCKEYAMYLSANANPGARRQRAFTEEDMKVFSFIAEMRQQGASFEDIRASLEIGQRGDAPGIEADELQNLIVGEVEKRLSLEVSMLRTALAEMNEKVREADRLKEENIRLKALLEVTQQTDHQRIDDLSGQLKAAQEELRRLEREIGRAYHEGYLEATQRDSGKQRE